MKLIKAAGIKLFRGAMDYLVASYKMVDALRPDDTPGQVFTLWLIMVILAIAGTVGMIWAVCAGVVEVP